MLCVLAAGSIARLRGDRMSICSNLQWIEFDGSKGCVNSWEFSRSDWQLRVPPGVLGRMAIYFQGAGEHY